MALSSKDGGKKSKYIIKLVTVDSIEYEFGATNKNGKTLDVSLTINYTAEKADGNTYQGKHFIDGNFKRSKYGSIEGWGSAFKIKDLLNALDPKEFNVTDDGEIDPQVFIDRHGKSFYLLRYISQRDDTGETIYRDFRGYAKDASSLETKFLNAVASDYPPYKYEPSLVDKEESKPFDNMESEDDSNEVPF